MTTNPVFAWATLTLSPRPVYYAVIHPEEKQGYLSRPAIERVTD